MSEDIQKQWKLAVEKGEVKYGRVLKNKARWQETIQYIKSYNLPVENWAVNAVENGHVCFMIKEVCDQKTRNVKFHNRVYRNYEDLVNEFRGRRDSINYSGTVENRDVCREMIEKY